MKRLALGALAALGACGGAGPAAHKDAGTAAGVAADDGMIECRDGGAAFARACMVERSDSPRGGVLTLRKPDGGFRRLLVTRDGRGVVAADGAEPARVTVLAPDRIEIAIGGDAFRLPARVAGR
jgi:hypothetical protein